ncbi:MAG: plastocyanin/azurin family copper-binding protein [Rhodothermales bacterium]
MLTTHPSTRRVAGACTALFFAAIGLLGSCAPPAPPGDPLDHAPGETGYYYQLVDVAIPDSIVLEVGGLAMLPDGRPAVATRRGEVWLIDNAYGDRPGAPRFDLFARGLHEPLGLLSHEGALYASQRGELTKMEDKDGDGRADSFEAIYSWPLTGNYHEYSYGPLLMPNGNFFVSLNLGWFDRGESRAKWRGWALEITPKGDMKPMAVGFRSPAGIGMLKNGDIFYGENQGDWIGSGWISHIEPGDFLGHPGGLKWTHEPEWSYFQLDYEDIPNNNEPMIEAAKTVEPLKLPAVWFPHTIMGISTSAIIQDVTDGGFGPFADQLFVGDQGHSKLMRVYLEKIDGAYQGANFPFFEGFASGILRTAWGKDQSLFVGQTSRGWDATGKAPFALQRLAWTGNMPFEMKEIHAMPDGFEIVFTQPADPTAAADPAMYAVQSFAYQYHNTYGSPAINIQALPVRQVSVSENGLKARLVVDGLREGYIHEIRLGDLPSQSGAPLLHDFAFYTLNNIPDGATLAAAGGEAATSTGGAGGDRARKHMTAQPASWTSGPDQTLRLSTQPGLRYSDTRFDVRAGSRIAFTFDNVDDMMHNVVITMPDAADQVAAAAMDIGIRGQELGYVPDAADVLFFTSLLQPATAETIYFEAPSIPGDYPFVCTFPGHSATMRGILRVRA